MPKETFITSQQIKYIKWVTELETHTWEKKMSSWLDIGTVSTIQTWDSIDKAVHYGKLDWTVRTEYIYREHTTFTSPGAISSTFSSEGEWGKFVIREDTNNILAVVGPRYKPVQNADAFKFFQPFIDEGFVDIKLTGELHHGRKVFIVCEANGPYTAITAAAAKPINLSRIMVLSNSHDGSSRVKVTMHFATQNKNASILALGSKNSVTLFKHKHTKTATSKLLDTKKTMDMATQRWDDAMCKYQKLASKPVKTTEALNFYLKQVLSHKKGNPDSYNRKRLKHIANIFNGYNDKNLFTAYLAVSEYLTTENARTADQRIDSVLFGEAAQLNMHALSSALLLLDD